MENNTRNEEMDINLVELFFVLLGRLWVIVLATVLGFGLAAGYTLGFMEPVYSSTSMIYILSKTTSVTSLADIQIGTTLTRDYKVFITSRPVVERVIDELNLDISYGAFVGNVTVDNPTDTRFINITVRNHDPYMAKTIVDKLTDVSVERMGEIMETQNPNVADYGHIPEGKSGPSGRRNGLIGAAIGFVLSCAYIILTHLMNDAIHTAEDVTWYLGLNTLGMIPLEEGTSKRETRGRDKDAKRARRKRKREKMKGMKKVKKVKNGGAS